MARAGRQAGERSVIFAYLVLAHDAPTQLEALITRLLAAPTDDFVVLHADRRSSLWPSEARRIAAHFAPRVWLVEHPLGVRWGHHSQLGAIHRLLGTALGGSFDQAHLLSGRDWPVASRATMVADIERSAAADCFIDTARTEQQERMQHWWFHDRFLNPRVEGGPGYRMARKLLRAASRTASRAVPRGHPFGPPWHKGSTWWSLPRQVCETVAHELTKIERSGRARFTACSDEHFIQTIVARACPHRLADPRRYTDWSAGESSPKTLTIFDHQAIVGQRAWFARKFDAGVDDWFLRAF